MVVSPAVRKLLTLSLIINCTGVLACVAYVYRSGGISFLGDRLVGPNAVYAPFRQSPFYQGRISAQTAGAAEGEDVFLGDSLTEHGNWNELFGCHAANRGIGGDEVLGVRSRLPSILAAKPSRVYLMVGLNDLMRGDNPEAVAGRYAELVFDLKRADVPVILQSVLPTRRPELSKAITALNERISRLADGREVRYVDLHSHFKDLSGLLDERYTEDGTHLNAAGYLLWRDRLQAELR